MSSEAKKAEAVALVGRVGADLQSRRDRSTRPELIEFYGIAKAKLGLFYTETEMIRYLKQYYDGTMKPEVVVEIVSFIFENMIGEDASSAAYLEYAETCADQREGNAEKLSSSEPEAGTSKEHGLRKRVARRS